MADADTIYRVLTIYDAETKAAEEHVGGLAIVLDHLINLAERAGHMLHTIWELSASAESAQIAMAGLMNAARFPGAEDFNMSMVMSSELMKIMRHDAAALSGTYEQMQTIFQAIIPVAHEAGQSLMTAEKMSGKVMEFGNTFNIPPEFIGREFRQMMEGRASTRNALFKDLSMFMGNISGQQFNALASPEKWKLVTEALEHFDPMFRKVGETGRAQLSTLESYWNQLVRLGTGGVFEGLKNELKEINDWYTAHQEQIDEIAKKIGTELGEALTKGFTIAKDAIAFIVAHREAIKTIAEMFLVFKGFSLLGGGGKSGGGTGFSQVLGGGAFGAALSQLTGNTDMVNTAMMTLEGSMATLPGTFGLIGQAALALHSVLSFVAGKIDESHKKDVDAQAEYGRIRDKLLMERKKGDTADVLGSVAAQLKDSGLIKNGRLDEKGLADYVTHANIQTDRMKLEFTDLARKAAEFERGRTAFGPSLPTAAEKARAMLDKAANGGTEKKPQMNVNVKIEQTINDAEDPARVLQLTKKALRESLERPVQNFTASVYR